MSEFAFAGTHVIADVSEIDLAALSDEQLLLDGLLRGIARSGATLCGMQTKRFEPTGMTALFLLAESHVSIHTYPEQRSLFFDAFTCGDHCTPQRILHELLADLGDCTHRTEVVGRGDRATRISAPRLLSA